MPKTVVGLFENAQLVEAAVLEIEALGFPRQEVRTVREPESFDVTGIMSFPRIDFEVDLSRELTRIGATIPETQAYVEGLRRGGALALATGSDEKVYAAGNIMNRHGAVDVEEVTGAEPVLAAVGHHSRTTPKRESSVMAGRIRQPGGGACFFVW
jgi:hypothetical protein